MKNLISAFICLLLAIPCPARTITVDDDGPADFNNIQAAIMATINDDTIIVAAGTYTGPGNRDIDFYNKRITVRSLDPNDPNIVAETIINGENRYRCFIFKRNESVNSVLDGLTITNGAADFGGGIRFYGYSGPTITNCTLSNNSASNSGGGICCSANSRPKISRCTIRNNLSAIYGGGICCDNESRPTISNCIIRDNEAEGDGGGIGVLSNSSPTITGCTIAGNSATSVGGLFCPYRHGPVANCIIWDNTPLNYSYPSSGTGNITYCCIRDWSYGGEGNISSNPLFADAAGGDYHLTAYSPCINAGNPLYSPLPGETDIEGNQRVINSRIDMGAYELNYEGPICRVPTGYLVFHSPQINHNPPPQTLSISNTGTGVMSWEITEDCSWLNAAPANGQITGTGNVVLSVDSSGLNPGIYRCELTIHSEQAINNPQTITVFLHIGSGRILFVPLEYATIQAAIDHSYHGDTVIVAPGTYTVPSTHPSGGIGFYGLKITVRSFDPDDPDIVAATIVDGENLYCGFHFENGEDKSSVLDGLTITNCKYSGIYCINSSPTIRNCIIRNNTNTRSGMGGGIDCYTSSPSPSCQCSPMIINCTISGNRVWTSGGGILCEPYSSPTITNCRITGNSSTRNNGGGIYCNRYSSPTITNCVISGNSAIGYGGGIYCYQNSNLKASGCAITGNRVNRSGGGIYTEETCRLTLANCNITANTAKENGGGIYYNSSSIWTLSNCTMAANSAGLLGGGIFCNSNAPIQLTSSILWGNNDSSGAGETAQIRGGIPDVIYSCIGDANPNADPNADPNAEPNDAYIPFGGEGNGNIDDDPIFIRYPDDGGDGWGDNVATAGIDEGANDDLGDLHLQVASPCINAGNPDFMDWQGNTDIDGQPRVTGGRIDMGADEYEPMIIVTEPDGGEAWAGGSRHEITWSAYEVESVNILFSKDGGGNWQAVESGVLAEAGSYLWHLPERVDSNNCLISIVPSVPDVNTICIESGLFTINRYPERPDVPPWWRLFGRKLSRWLEHKKPGPELGCVKWQFETGGPVTAGVAIGFTNKIHIACEDGKLYTLAPDGSLLWTYDANSPLISSPAIGYYEVVYVGSEDGRLHAVDRNGQLLWTHKTGGPIFVPPTVSTDGRIYVGSDDGILCALAPDGSELWSFETARWGKLGGSIFASPAIGDDGTVYIAGLFDPNVYALDPADGSIKWACNLERRIPIVIEWPRPPTTVIRIEFGWPFASPAVAEDGTIYHTPLNEPNLYAIEPNGGTVIWSTMLKPYCDYTKEWYPSSVPPCDNLEQQCGGEWFGIPLTEWYQCEMTGTVYGYRGEDRLSNCWSDAALGPDGTIYVSFDDPYLRAVDPNGSIKWVRRVGMIGGFTLTVGSNGLIYATSDDGRLYVVSPEGEVLSQFESDSCLSFPVIARDGTIIVSDANNTVWAIGGKDCEGLEPLLHRPEDLNINRAVDFYDLAILTADWLGCTDDTHRFAPCDYSGEEIYLEGDVDRNMYVNFDDFAAIANRWLNEE